MGTGLDCSWINELNPILLKKGEWEAYVLPQYGMNAIALLNGKKRLLRTPDTKAEFLALPEGFGTPPLLPANRTADGIFRFEGKQYQLPINDRFHTHNHGFLHRKAHIVSSCGTEKDKYFRNSHILLQLMLLYSRSRKKRTYEGTHVYVYESGH